MRAGRAGGWGWGVLGRSWGSGGGADRGVATVWAAVTVAALCTVFAVVLALGQAVAARHRAGGAADLAALAAADLALEGAEAACEAARRVALAQDAVVVRCAVEGEVADVTARSGFGLYLPTVRARAGPQAGPSGRAPTDAPARPPADPSGDAPAEPPGDVPAEPPGDAPAEPRGGHRADPLAGVPSDDPIRPQAGSPVGAAGEPRAGP
ncbi:MULTISPECIES: Rv3654c family TadE-like protein [unclassified Streptomyces]|uniref:Rv3654c family TadE-like protein n=1 Tax=unclassified Streptomyces TaxID=2593676 RepID=UPI0024A7B88A|nr:MULTISPECIES: Rv3654c family TadE-like protein [unclassified Streptomyces]